MGPQWKGDVEPHRPTPHEMFIPLTAWSDGEVDRYEVSRPNGGYGWVRMRKKERKDGWRWGQSEVKVNGLPGSKDRWMHGSFLLQKCKTTHGQFNRSKSLANIKLS